MTAKREEKKIELKIRKGEQYLERYEGGKWRSQLMEEVTDQQRKMAGGIQELLEDRKFV